jgi:hypothetical protein
VDQQQYLPELFIGMADTAALSDGARDALGYLGEPHHLIDYGHHSKMISQSMPSICCCSSGYM